MKKWFLAGAVVAACVLMTGCVGDHEAEATPQTPPKAQEAAPAPAPQPKPEEHTAKRRGANQTRRKTQTPCRERYDCRASVL
ncbi:hypothetical protein NHP190003_09120 [Helicobacter sp. NHP19-003]|uniref:Lipoprotein n=1 Tax=Helicobacter gastrocanis TaxID=2849641 RepID=A0ABN6I226_9HELI|nr:hypothetical protein NHP190003_09120 [Helicobacter sp. NHP19-003]